MKSDGRNCEELPSSYLLIALRSGIGRISLDTPEMFDVVLPIDGVHGAVVIDFHYEHNLLFYADVNADAVKRVNMKNFNDVKTIVSSDLNTPNGIAVDWMADNLYWSDAEHRMIEVSRLDGSNRKTLINQTVPDVRSLIIYKYYLFFSDWSLSPRIERCLLDASERKVIIDSDLGYPTGLAIDFVIRKLFWSDALKDRIEMSDLDGKKRTQLMHAEHPFGFTMTSNYFYYTDWYNKSVIRTARHSNGNVEEVVRNLRGALEIRSVNADRQPKYFNPCSENNGGCSHLCLYLGGTRYVCDCPNNDTKPCTKEYKESSEKPPENDDLIYVPSSTEGSPPTSKAKDSSVMLGMILFMLFCLVMVISAIICEFKFLLSWFVMLKIFNFFSVLICHSKNKEKNKARMTFSNPNYSGSGYNDEGHKSTFFKKLKYDKAQVSF
jgi:low-density lipoprotein receptor-related protein 4